MKRSELALPGAIPRWAETKYGASRQLADTPADAAADELSARSAREAEDKEDRAVLLLMVDAAAPGPWSGGEVERALGDRVAANDAVRRLRTVGLLHELREGYVFPTRAALRAYALLAG